MAYQISDTCCEEEGEGSAEALNHNEVADYWGCSDSGKKEKMQLFRRMNNV